MISVKISAIVIGVITLFLSNGNSLESSGKGPIIVVKNKSEYGADFLKGLKQLNGFKKFELIDSLMIVDEKDTAHFPNFGKKKTMLTGRKNDLAIALSIEQRNYTTISYKIEMVEFGKANHNQSGSATLSAGFFLGDETDENSATGNSYLSTEYADNKKIVTHLSESGVKKSYLLAKLKKNCNGKIMEITLDNFPNLIEK